MMKFNRLNKKTLIIFSLILVEGCSYRPPLVEANIPLISEQVQVNTSDTCLIALPGSFKKGDKLKLDCTGDITHQIYDIYNSALGNYCMVLFSEQSELTICNKIAGQETHWFKVQSVMSGM